VDSPAFGFGNSHGVKLNIGNVNVGADGQLLPPAGQQLGPMVSGVDFRTRAVDSPRFGFGNSHDVKLNAG
jgi:hypothetical protein